MSHYTVAVFTDGKKSVDELLAPYDEGIEVEPYIGRTKQEMLADAKKCVQEAEKVKAEGRNPGWFYQRYLDAKTDEELYALQRDEDCYSYDEDGNELTTYNPDSKWDWYQVGGRWMDAFESYGVDPEGTRVGDIKSLFDMEQYKKSLRFWEIYVDGDEPKTDEDRELVKWAFYKPEYFKNRYGDKETYARCRAGFYTFAVLLPDGTWHEPGQMGWFGCSSETDEDGLAWEKNYVKNFLESADPNWTLTIVDCHI